MCRNHDHLMCEPYWSQLPFVAIQEGLPAETIDGVTYPAEPGLELRDCPACKSTLGKAVAS